MRASPSALPIWTPRAKHESVGYAITPFARTMSATCPMIRDWGLSGCTSKYRATLVETTRAGEP